MASESGKGKREIFVWKQRHEDFLLREVLVLEPHQFWSGSKERGAVWTTIADNLKAFDMKVSQRSVRERFEKIMKEFKAKEAKEVRASGVDVEYTERDKLLTDIVEKMEEFEEAMEKVKGKEKKNRESAEEMRKRAVEQLGETRRRHALANDDVLDAEVLESDEGILVTPEKRRRRSNGDIMKILEQPLAAKRVENEESSRLWEREIALMENQMLSQQQFQRTLLEQQQQFQQQQQNVTFAMVTTLSELVKNMRK